MIRLRTCEKICFILSHLGDDFFHPLALPISGLKLDSATNHVRGDFYHSPDEKTYLVFLEQVKGMRSNGVGYSGLHCMHLTMHRPDDSVEFFLTSVFINIVAGYGFFCAALSYP